MSRGKLIVAAGIGAALLAGVAYVFRQPVFCGTLIIPFETAARFTVKVPEAQNAAFDKNVTSFMADHGLSVVKGTYRTSSPLGTPMRTAYQVEGCDGANYIWSSNSDKPREYLVTFHYNPLFKDRTKPLSDAFVAEFRPHYDVKPYTGWHPEPNQTQH